MLEKIEEQIISQIKTKKIKPLDRSWFIIKRLSAWLLAGLFIILGAVSVSLIITILRFGDFDVYRLVSSSPVVFFILVFPYFWLLCYLFFLGFSLWKMRHSQYGYRYQKIWLWLSFFLVSLLLGVIFTGTGLGKQAENYLADKVSVYRQINYMRGMWDHPEKGMLSGEITAIDGRTLWLKDFSNKLWKVDMSATQITPMVSMMPGGKIKLVGQMMAEQQFKAQEIRSWGCGCAASQSQGAECSCGQTGSSGGSCSSERK